MAIDFQAWPKIPRLNREMVITEKIDGTNSAVIIEDHGICTRQYLHNLENQNEEYSTFVVLPYNSEDDSVIRLFEVGAQSRNRLLKPGDDNFGFAQWVWDNAYGLAKSLGEGRHFGEWWGSGIQRGYGLPKGEKRFSLFNVKRYRLIEFEEFGLQGVSIVPILWEGTFDQEVIDVIVREMRRDGSFVGSLVADQRFPKPEGVVVYHAASNSMFKVLCENDDVAKGQVA